MSDEAKFSVTKNFHTVRGDTLAEFQQNVESLLGAGAFQRIVESFADAYGVGFQAATHNVQAAGLAPVAAPPIPVAAPPVAVPQAAPAAPVAPPTITNPGNCIHGVRVYVDKPARGKPWRRWECAIPWSKDLAKDARCAPINVEG